VGDGWQPALGQEDAQQGTLELVGALARWHAKGIVGSHEAGAAVACIAEELGQRFGVPVDVQGERRLGDDLVFGRAIGGDQPLLLFL
jgi:hypothetical protein